jgi:hypothetical protein
MNVCRVPNCCTIPAYVSPKIVPSLRTKLVEKKRKDAAGAASPGDALPWATTVRLKGLDVRIALPLVAGAADRGDEGSRSTGPGSRATEPPSHRAIEPSTIDHRPSTIESSSHESPFRDHGPIGHVRFQVPVSACWDDGFSRCHCGVLYGTVHVLTGLDVKYWYCTVHTVLTVLCGAGLASRIRDWI